MSRLLLHSAIALFSSASLRLIPLSKIIGSAFSFFRLDQALLPLAGTFGGPWAIFIVYGIKTALRFCSHSLIAAAGYHLPTAAASIYLATLSPAVRIGLPLSCIALFIAHPVGASSWIYALYWLIPASIGILKKPSFFIKALGATFTAHAVGSTLWLYSHATDCHFWHSLISIVWLERLHSPFA